MKFSKPALDLTQQLQKWQSRGLVVPNPAEALHYLQFVGYYRFSAYTLPFQMLASPDKPFASGTTFEHVLSVYAFDRELRLLVMDAIERVEVAVRSSMVNHMSLKHGAHWFMDASHFRVPSPTHAQVGPRGFDHSKFLDTIDDELGIPRSAKMPVRQHNEVFINHYFSKYTDPYQPPAWMVFELVSLGTLSLVFSSLKDNNDRAAIAKPFAVDEQVLGSWLHCLSYVRNLCAHHGRLWNRQLVIKPIIAKKHITLVIVKDRFYSIAFILNYLLGIIAPRSEWHDRLRALVQSYPVANAAAMGFPQGWESLPVWNPPAAQTTT
jgi:abortive infection bacteriophage resistance protein